jgi:Mg/Co/Ni transporter MgtE
MSTDVVSINVTADQEELAELVSRYDFLWCPWSTTPTNCSVCHRR